MDILVCAYPLFLTYQYYVTPTSTTDDLEFLAVWWSSFGTITLLENYAGLDNIPLYSFLKGGILLSMYSSSYREWLTGNALQGITSGLKKAKQTTISIVDEHFPKVKEYIKLDTEQEGDSSANGSNGSSGSNGWFGWLSSRKNE